MSLLESDKAAVAVMLGRDPRGLEEIAYRSLGGEPMVIRVSPLVDGKPFPTLFWLVDKRLNYAIDQVEAAGVIADFQRRVDADESLQVAMKGDHLAYIQLRQQFITPEMAEHIAVKGYGEALAARGIGGIADFQRIRCLHTYYAAHLVTPNAIGRMLDSYWQGQGVSFDHF